MQDTKKLAWPTIILGISRTRFWGFSRRILCMKFFI
jgi:hypothetical protein